MFLERAASVVGRVRKRDNFLPSEYLVMRFENALEDAPRAACPIYADHNFNQLDVPPAYVYISQLRHRNRGKDADTPSESKRRMMNRTRILLVALIAMLVCTAAQTGSAASQHHLTKKELKALIANAKTAEDHQKIAAYYRAEARRIRQDAKEHQELAETYAKTVPNPMEAKHGDMAGQGTSHCKKWAELDNQEADEADALAASHEEMAKAAH